MLIWLNHDIYIYIYLYIMKYQGKTSLKNQYALKDKGQGGKTGPVQGWVPVGMGRVKGKGEANMVVVFCIPVWK
jgi:hypothetical protein